MIQISVGSFTTPGINYSISTDPGFTRLLSCTCVSYNKHRVPCKHLYLVLRIYIHMRICYDGSVEPHLALNGSGLFGGDDDNGDNGDGGDSSDDELPARLKLMLNPSIIAQLSKARAEKKEAARKEREAEQVVAFKECEGRLALLGTIRGYIVFAPVTSLLIT
ncbi:hypothetical protein EDD21DRAFT_42873 [Dissophora ornata]|nr:hypothetical protein EDD21DRAFT_42873 [Dissophora ornata]